MDFYGSKISNLIINDVQVDSKAAFKNGTIVLSELKLGPNIVTMNFLNQYRNDGFGFHSFVD